MEEKELISVIIPTFNREKTIKRALESVLAQTYYNIEVIIVDDASTDKTFDIIKTFEDKRIRYYRNDENLGPSVSRNRGVKYSKGSLVAFQDSDDEWISEKLEKQYNKLKNNKEYDLVYCPYLYFGKYSTFQIPSSDMNICEVEGYIYESLLQSNKIGTPAVLMKKEIFMKSGGFDENILALEDWELMLRISRDYCIGYVNEILVHAYFSNRSVNNNYYNTTKAAAMIIRKNMNLVSDVCMLENLIQYALENSVASNVDCTELFVPQIIQNRLEYKLLFNNCKRLNLWRNKYNALSWLEDKANSYFLPINHSFVIYGAGIIGKKLIKVLSGIDKKVDCVIDNNTTVLKNVKVINLNELQAIELSGICIITVPDDENKIASQIQQFFCGDIVNIYDII